MSHVTVVVGERPAKTNTRRKGGASVALRSQDRRLAAAAQAEAAKKPAPRKRAPRKKATTA
jgi:hypothetical protein